MLGKTKTPILFGRYMVCKFGYITVNKDLKKSIKKHMDSRTCINNGKAIEGKKELIRLIDDTLKQDLTKHGSHRYVAYTHAAFIKAFEEAGFKCKTYKLIKGNPYPLYELWKCPFCESCENRLECVVYSAPPEIQEHINATKRTKTKFRLRSWLERKKQRREQRIKEYLVIAVRRAD